MAFTKLHDEAFALFNQMIAGSEIEDALSRFLTMRTKMTSYKTPVTISTGEVYDIGNEFPPDRIDVLYRIGEFLNVESAPILEVNNKKVQELKTYTLASLVRDCFDDHYHVMKSPKGDAMHRNKFHNESLGTHSIDVMLRQIARADPVDAFRCGLEGLVHDLGKRICWKAMNIPTDDPKVFIKTIGFPFHGEAGRMILTRLWGENYARYFSLDEWNDICDVVGTHMCGYRCPCTSMEELAKDQMWSYKLNLFRLSSHRTRNDLQLLSTSDMCGAYADSDSVDDLKAYGESRLFLRKMFDASFDPDQLNRDRMGRGMVFSLYGASGEGKTTMANQIIRTLEENGFPRERCHLVSRDDYIMRHVVEVLRRLKANGRCPTSVPDPDTVDMDHISEIDGDSYRKFYAFYEKNKKWNPRDPLSGMSSKVNRDIRLAIRRFIMDGDVVLVDSMVLLFKMDSKNSIFPPEVANAYRFNIFVLREEPITKEDCRRHGMNMSTQMKLFSITDRTIWNPFPRGFINRGMTNDCIRDIRTYATRPNERMLSDLERSYRMPDRTHFVSWRKDYSVGLDLLIQDIRQFVPVLMSTTFLTTSTLNEMNLRDVVQYLDDTYGFEQMRLFFVSKHFRVNSMFNNRVILFTYHNGNMVWKPKWAKQTRGTGFIKTSDGTWHCFKDPMPRGAEVATKSHDDEHIETQEMKTAHDIDQLDQDQADSYHYLNGNKAVPSDVTTFGYLDAKKDGSLLMANWIPAINPVHDVLKDLIRSVDDTFATTVIEVCDRLKLPGFFMLCTQNTIMIPDVMKDYTITALYEAFDAVMVGMARMEGVPTRVLLRRKSNAYAGNIRHLLLDILPVFFIKCHNAIASYTDKRICCLAFESIIADRTTYLDTKHYELACSYDHGSICFLGATLDVGPEQGRYVPHFFLREMVHVGGFIEPKYWKIETPDQIMKMIDYLTEMLRVKSKDEFDRSYRHFFELYSPENPVTGVGHLDFEGFILFRLLTPGSEEVVYSKVKTIWYYHCHGHLTPNKIPMLMALTDEADKYFPILARIRGYFFDLPGTIKMYLKDVLEQMEKVCDRTPPVNDEIIPYFDDLKNGQLGFWKRHRDGRYATIINNSLSFQNYLAPAFFRYFPELAVGFESSNQNNLMNTLREMLNEIKPWNDGWEKKINVMTNISTLDPVMTNLFYLTGLNGMNFV